MCIIIAKPENIQLPSKETLEICFQNNKDGAGIMFAHKGSVHILKGFMTFQSLIDKINELSKKINLDKISMIIHFRIGTQGKTNEENTHPFPITEDILKLTSNKVVCNIGVAHNGIISLTRSYTSMDYSDTVLFVRDYLSCIVEKPDFYKNPKMLKIIGKLADSKLAFLSNNGHITTIGEFINKDGVLYSNSTYVKRNYYNYGYSYPYEDEWGNGDGNGYYKYWDDKEKRYVWVKRTTETSTTTPSTALPMSEESVKIINRYNETKKAQFEYLNPIKDTEDKYILDYENTYIPIENGMFFLAPNGDIYGYDNGRQVYMKLLTLKLYDKEGNVMTSHYETNVSKYVNVGVAESITFKQYDQMLFKGTGEQETILIEGKEVKV